MRSAVSELILMVGFGLISRFNHWAHLGGVAFGALYWTYGPRVWEFFREASLGGLPPSLTILPLEWYQNREPESTSTAQSRSLDRVENE